MCIRDRNNIDPADEAAINAAVDNVKITIEYKDGEQQVILNGENVTSLLRTEATGNMASKTSKYKAVRSKLVDLQRELAAAENVVMDGRDIGTTVLPDANVKIYPVSYTHLPLFSRVRPFIRCNRHIGKRIKKMQSGYYA